MRCKWCGKLFDDGASNKKYCSRKCNQDGSNNNALKNRRRAYEMAEAGKPPIGLRKTELAAYRIRWKKIHG